MLEFDRLITKESPVKRMEAAVAFQAEIDNVNRRLENLGEGSGKSVESVRLKEYRLRLQVREILLRHPELPALMERARR